MFGFLIIFLPSMFRAQFHISWIHACWVCFVCIIQVKLANWKQTVPQGSFWFMLQANIKSCLPERRSIHVLSKHDKISNWQEWRCVRLSCFSRLITLVVLISLEGVHFCCSCPSFRNIEQVLSAEEAFSPRKETVTVSPLFEGDQELAASECSWFPPPCGQKYDLHISIL